MRTNPGALYTVKETCEANFRIAVHPVRAHPTILHEVGGRYAWLFIVRARVSLLPGRVEVN
jgi:hypothetical protein